MVVGARQIFTFHPDVEKDYFLFKKKKAWDLIFKNLTLTLSGAKLSNTFKKIQFYNWPHKKKQFVQYL